MYIENYNNQQSTDDNIYNIIETNPFKDRLLEIGINTCKTFSPVAKYKCIEEVELFIEASTEIIKKYVNDDNFNHIKQEFIKYIENNIKKKVYTATISEFRRNFDFYYKNNQEIIKNYHDIVLIEDQTTTEDTIKEFTTESINEQFTAEADHLENNFTTEDNLTIKNNTTEIIDILDDTTTDNTLTTTLDEHDTTKTTDTIEIFTTENNEIFIDYDTTDNITENPTVIFNTTTPDTATTESNIISSTINHNTTENNFTTDNYNITDSIIKESITTETITNEIKTTNTTEVIEDVYTPESFINTTDDTNKTTTENNFTTNIFLNNQQEEIDEFISEIVDNPFNIDEGDTINNINKNDYSYIYNNGNDDYIDNSKSDWDFGLNSNINTDLAAETKINAELDTNLSGEFDLNLSNFLMPFAIVFVGLLAFIGFCFSKKINLVKSTVGGLGRVVTAPFKCIGFLFKSKQNNT